MADVELRGLSELYRKLNAVQATDLLVPPISRGALRLQKRMASYPPAIPGSKYKRTGSYGRLWTVKIIRHSNGVTALVGINLVYAPYVGSSLFQWRGHRGRWTSDQAALVQELPIVTREAQAAVDRALAR